MVTLPQAGHLVTVEKPDALVGAITDCINENKDLSTVPAWLGGN